MARDPNSYLLQTDHGERSYHVFAIATEHPPLPSPAFINVIISDVNPADQESRLVRHVLTHDADLDLDRELSYRIVLLTAEFPRDRIRWLVGVRPLVIAIGATDSAAARVPEGATLYSGQVVQIGAAIRLVTEADLAQMAYAVIRARAGDKRPAEDGVPAEVDHFSEGLSLGELYQRLAAESRRNAGL
jgi:hypothetical protein